MLTFASIAAVLAAGTSGQAQNLSDFNAGNVRLNPENTVLIYVDYVTGLDNLMNTIPPEVYANNVEAFTKFNPGFQIPAAILGEESDYYGTFLPAVTENVTFEAERFPRTQISGFTPAMEAWLAEQGRPNVVIGGISIDNCTLHTTLDLLAAGYEVYVIADVSGSNSKIAEDAAITRLTQAGAVVTGWLPVLTDLGHDFAGPYGPFMAGIVRDHWPASTIGETTDLTPDGHGLQPAPAD